MQFLAYSTRIKKKPVTFNTFDWQYIKIKLK